MSKNILTSLLLCLFTSISVGQVKVSDIVFKKKQIDLGAIYQESGVTSCVFEFTNNSTNDFVIRSLEVSCGCTTPHSNKKTYTPGESGKITVNFDPKGIVGKVNKWVQIRGNFSDALDVELTFNEIDCHVNSLIWYLQNKTNLKKGDKVALQMPNLLQYPIAIFACLKAI